MNKIAVVAGSVKQISLLDGEKLISRFIIGNNKYGMRLAKNFSLEEIKEVLAITEKEVYIAVNKIFHERELEGLTKYLLDLNKLGAAGIIFSDFAVLEIIRENNLNFKTVYSTDTTITNYYFTTLAKDNNIDEIELAKELTLKEMQEINAKKEVPVNVTIFGHIYMYHSARALIENYFEFNELVKEEKKYYLYDEERNLHYPIIENEQGTNILSAFDICLFSKIEKIFATGFDYLKIDSFGYSDDEFIEIVKKHCELLKLFNSNDDLLTENGKIAYQNSIKIQKNKKYSTGFLFKDSIY